MSDPVDVAGRLDDGCSQGRSGMSAAASPHDRLAATVRAVQTARLGGYLDAPGRQVAMDEIVGVDRSWLQSEFARLTGNGVPGPTAASYLVGWYAGSIAEHVGVGLAASRAAITFDPASVRWTTHAEYGWVMAIDGDTTITVAAGHLWAGRPGVDVVAGEPDVAERAVTALVDAVRPIIEACHSLARVGLTGLWNEVGDAVAMVLCYQSVIPASDGNVGLLETASGLAEVPWKSRPSLWFVDAGLLGRVHVAQKGGCCLAYQEPVDEAVVEIRETEQHVEPDPYHAAYRERFPDVPGEPRYCSTCRFRDPGDCAARQVTWHEFHPPSAGEATI